MNNKNPHLRFRVIHAELKKGVFVTKERLFLILRAKGLGVSIRTIERDLHIMKHNFGAPIEKKGNYGFYYSDLNYDFEKKPTLREAWEIVNEIIEPLLE